MPATPRNVTVVGAGYVGLVTAVGLAQLGHTVELVETRADRLESLRRGVVPILEAGLQEAFEDLRGRISLTDHPEARADVVMICVGTPIGHDGRSDLRQLQSALRSLGAALGDDTPLVVRSTLPPGTTRRVAEWAGVPTFRVFTNPEFLRQGSALADFLNPTRLVIGRFPDARPEMVDLVAGLFADLPVPMLVVDVAEAELIKNGANAFLALKLSFVNELAAMSERYGADVDAIIDGIGRDPRIGRDFFRPSFGFGGSCLPKELRALAAAGQDVGLDMHVTRAASDANRASQARFLDRIEAVAGGLDGRTIGLLGLAFKANTDDIRDSPAVWLASRLLSRGARVRAHDPAAAANAAAAVSQLEIVATPEEALAGADVGVIATEWPQYRSLDWEGLAPTMAARVLVDGRRLLDAASLRRLGYRVEVLGTAPEPEAAGSKPQLVGAG